MIVLCRHNECRNDTFFFTKIYIFISLERGPIFVGAWETDRMRLIQTAILTHNFSFFWSYHAVLSARPYIFSSLTRSTQPRAACASFSPGWPWFSICWLQDLTACWLLQDCPRGVPSHLLVLFVTDWISSGCKLRLTISHVGICIYHFTMLTYFCSTKWLLLLIYTGVSCAVKSLIDGLVKGHYATIVCSGEAVSRSRNFFYFFPQKSPCY